MFNNIVTIQKKDINTGEITEECSSSNSQTLGSIKTYVTGGGSLSSSTALISPKADIGTPRSFIQLIDGSDLENVINEATTTPREIPSVSQHKTAQITGINQPIVSFDATNKIVEYEFNGRLDPPSTGNTRSITSVQLAVGEFDNNFGLPGFAVILEAPCEQNDQEILDIFYRVRITGNTNSNDYYWATYLPLKFYPEEKFDANGNLIGASNSFRIPNVMGPNIILSYGHPNNRDKMPVSITYGILGNDSIEGFSNFNLTQLTGIKNWSFGIEDQVGQTYNSINFFTGRNEELDPNAQLGFINDSTAALYQFSHQILPDDISPLQGKFLHASDAVRPYLDPSNLGSGQGDITFDGSSWNEDESVVYRLLFTTGGDVGSAEYKLFKKIIFGYPNNEYINEFWGGKRLLVLPPQRLSGVGVRTQHSLNKPDSYWAQGSSKDFIHFEDEFFDNGVMPNVIRYDSKHIISFNTSGLSIINIYTDNYVNINSQTTPSLNTNNINDVVVNEITGEIWVATTDAGLFRISADFQTITSITVGTPSITDSICRSVDYKNNGDVWAAFSGGLALSTDNGSTWTEFNEGTTPQFSFAGISDNNWGNIQGIVVDKDSTDDRLLIVKAGNKLTTTIIWWSRVGSSTSSDAFDSTINPNEQDLGGNTDYRSGEFYNNIQAFAVSKWIKYYPGTNGTFFILSSYTPSAGWASSTEYKTVNFGETQNRANFVIKNFAHDTPRMKEIAFEQDSSGNYGTIIIGQPSVDSKNQWAINLMDPDFILLEQWNDFDWFSNIPDFNILRGDEIGETAFYHTYMGKGIGVLSPDDRSTLVNRMFSDPDPFGDSEFTSKRSLMWEEYGWDGSQWIQGNPNSKIVHSTQESLIDGLTVQFADAGSPNFVLNEYVDMNVFKGIHNDNATEFSYSVPVTVRNSSVLEDLSQNTVPVSSFGTVSNKKLNFITSGGVSNNTSEKIYNVDGIIGQWIDFNFNGAINPDNIDHVVFSEIIFDGDFSISFKTTKDGREDNNSPFSSIGMLPLSNKGSSSSYADPNYLWEFTGKEFRIKSGALGTNTSFVGPTVIVSKDDIYTMERVGTDLNFLLNGTILHTFTNVTDSLIVQAGFLNEGFRTFFDMNINSYVENGFIVELGDSGNATGLFDPKYAIIEAYLDPVTSSFTINGIDAPIITDPHIEPAPGSVTIYSKAGWAKFNSADAGSTISGKYQVLYGFN